MYKHKHFLFIVNLLLKPLNLTWSPTSGLIYKYKLFFGDIGIVVIKDFKLLLKFLNIDDIYLSAKQQYILSEFLYIIKDSKYTYLPSILTKPTDLSPEMNEFYNKLTGLIKLSIGGEIKDSITFSSNYIPYKDRDKVIYLIDRAFKLNGEFLRKINSFDNHLDRAKKVFIKNKFNGKLVMQWIPELKPGKILADTIAGFKSYIEQEEREHFNYYVKKTNVNQIKVRFIFWHDKVLHELDNEFDKIPF